ncbi:MAG: glycosyltransferase family 4 protein [Gammaproteobacteria bacterium]|nr:glycosyltransferase family 4 protein [Gammaproteobacteria bacterium]
MKSERIKILHVAATTTGGVGQVILDLLKHLDKDEFDVSVAFGQGYWLDKEFATLDNRKQLLPLTRKISILGSIKSIIILYKLIKKEGFDIVHTHTSIGGLVGRIAAWLAGVPVVIFHIHALASHPHQNPLKRKVFWILERLLDLITDHYISVSEEYKRQGCSSGLFSPSRVDTIINGAEPSPLPPKAKADTRAKLRKQLAIAPDTFVVGTVTRLEPQKAVHVLIKGFSLFTQKHPEVQLLIAGDGYLHNQLELLTEKLDVHEQVHFLGWRDDVRELLTVFDVFALSSRWEGLPIAILEAMSGRCPVISTSIGGIPEMIESELDGLLVPEDDDEMLFQALQRVYQNQALAERLAKNALNSFENKFSMARMIKQHEALYKRLFASSKP